MFVWENLLLLGGMRFWGVTKLKLGGLEAVVFVGQESRELTSQKVPGEGTSQFPLFSVANVHHAVL